MKNFKGIALPYNNKIGEACKQGKYSELCNEFRYLAKALHRSYENECNYGLTPRQKTRQENLTKRVYALAKQYNLFAYLQTDPRGGTLYLSDKPIPENDYSRQAVFIW